MATAKRPVRKYDSCDAEESAPPQRKTFRPDIAAGKAFTYCKLRDDSKAIKSQMDELSTALKDLAEKHGVQSGKSFVLELPGIKVQKVGVTSNIVDHKKALGILKKIGGDKLVERCTRRVLDEKELEVAFQEGIIGMEDIDAFTSEKVSYSIRVDDLR